MSPIDIRSSPRLRRLVISSGRIGRIVGAGGVAATGGRVAVAMLLFPVIRDTEASSASTGADRIGTDIASAGGCVTTGTRVGLSGRTGGKVRPGCRCPGRMGEGVRYRR